jgi:hypothetical protein
MAGIFADMTQAQIAADTVVSQTQIFRLAGLAGDPRRWDLLGAIDVGLGEFGQAPAVAAGAATQHRESLGHVQVESFGQYALSLFDQDAAVQRDS